MAAFVKPNEGEGLESPQDAAVSSVEEEVLEGTDEDEEAISERSEEDLKRQRDMDVLEIDGSITMSGNSARIPERSMASSSVLPAGTSTAITIWRAGVA